MRLAVALYLWTIIVFSYSEVCHAQKYGICNLKVN